MPRVTSRPPTEKKWRYMDDGKTKYEVNDEIQTKDKTIPQQEIKIIHDKGPIGEKGKQGEKGIQGEKGVQGEKGLKGEAIDELKLREMIKHELAIKKKPWYRRLFA